MKAESAVAYGILTLAVYVAITANVFLSNGLAWFLYSYLIPVTVALIVAAILNTLRMKKYSLTNFKFFKEDKHNLTET